MKAIRFLVTFLLFVLFFYGCKKQESIFIGKGKYGLVFEQEYRFPSGEPILEVFGSQSIQIIDTLLLAHHRYDNPAYHWDIYSLDNGTHLKSILRTGRGPAEVLFADYAGQYEKTDDGIWMYFMDLNTSRFMKINLTASIESGNDVIELISQIEPQKSPYFALGNDEFIYPEYNHEDGYVSVMKNDSSWKNPKEVKKFYRDITSGDFSKLPVSLCYNEKKQKICVNPRYVNDLQIIDLAGNNDIVFSTAGPNNWKALREPDFWESKSVFYGAVQTSDDYIFGLYTNKKLLELVETPRETEIHIFDWEGNPVAKIYLEDYIGSFAVDIRNKVLYGIDNLEQIYKYDISACLTLSPR
jgi:hypothetical protein